MYTKNKPRKKLTPLQEIRLLRISLMLFVAAVLWLLLSPSNGLYGLIKIKKEVHQLEQQTTELAKSNQVLRQEIERLRTDPEYLERIAREKYNMLKKNEQLFDFSKSPDGKGAQSD